MISEIRRVCFVIPGLLIFCLFLLAPGRPLLAQTPPKNLYGIAVVIGNTDYRHGMPGVEFADNDAAAMKSIMINVLGYKPRNIIDLRNATREDMDSVFGNAQTHHGRLFDWVEPGKSDVVVFYAGHGAQGSADRQRYLLPVDGNPEQVEATGYSLKLLFENLGKSDAKSITLYLDAGFSGRLANDRYLHNVFKFGADLKLPDVLPPNFTVFTASTGYQIAFRDRDTNHGLFTGVLLDGLAGKADDNAYGIQDDVVSALELKAYLDDEMTYQARLKFSDHQVVSFRGKSDKILVPKVIRKTRISSKTRTPARRNSAKRENKKTIPYQGNWVLKFEAKGGGRSCPHYSNTVKAVISDNDLKGMTAGYINLKGQFSRNANEISGRYIDGELRTKYSLRRSGDYWRGTWEGEVVDSIGFCRGTVAMARNLPSLAVAEKIPLSPPPAAVVRSSSKSIVRRLAVRSKSKSKPKFDIVSAGNGTNWRAQIHLNGYIEADFENVVEFNKGQLSNTFYRNDGIQYTMFLNGKINRSGIQFGINFGNYVDPYLGVHNCETVAETQEPMTIAVTASCKQNGAIGPPAADIIVDIRLIYTGES